MLARVISGGQTGADQGGWRAARAAGLETGGWMPRGFLTEQGPRPTFAREFRAEEHASDDPAGRTVANVRAADATLIFAGEPCGTGSARTIRACREASQPFRVVRVGPEMMGERPHEVAAWLASLPGEAATLNVAGDRESAFPGLAARVEAFLGEVFKLVEIATP